VSARRFEPAVVRAIAVRLVVVAALQGLAIASYYSVIAMYLKLPFGSGQTPFVFAQWWHLVLGDALFVVAALVRRSSSPAAAAPIGAVMPFAAVAFGAWAGTDPPVGRVLVATLLLVPALLFSAWTLPRATSSGEGAS
jgi:hypothetical protein